MLHSWIKDARQATFWRIIEVSDTESSRTAMGRLLGESSA
jgi:hypothetical protein